MATCFTIFMITLFISTLLYKTLHNHLTRKTKQQLQLPPGPPKIPFIGNLLWLHKSFPQMKAIIPTLRAKYGPIFTLHVGSKPFIFIASNSMAHQALIIKGATFADRPPAIPTDKFLTSDQHNINWAFYGPTWLLLRRNLTSNILQPAKIRSFACARKWVMDILINRLRSHNNTFYNCQISPKSLTTHVHIEVTEHIQHALFCLLAFMCFGDKFTERQIQDIKDVQRRLQLSLDNFKILNLFPSLGKVLFRKRWEKLRQLRKDQENVMVPFIRVRKAIKEEKQNYNEPFVPYVDTLFDLQLPEEKRKLEETEIVTLCSEFFTAGTDTTSTALQWILGCLVKYPQIQEKLFMEIKEVIIGDHREVEEVKEDDLPKMPYVKAVVLEGLRRHPPSHFLVPHAVTENVEVDGFSVPKNSIVSFMVAEIGRDPNTWENPMEFKPERFLNGEANNFDITGSREIKMIPFGVGRRMCPGYGLALLHLEYLLANMIWNFKFDGLKGNEVDLTEKHEFTTVMKNSLKVRITPR